MAVASLANRIQVNTNCANNDALYGPYNSISEAKTSIPSALLNGEDAMGRTIGVLERGKVVEYWWQLVEGGEQITFYNNSIEKDISCEYVGEISNEDTGDGDFSKWLGSDGVYYYIQDKEEGSPIYIVNDNDFKNRINIGNVDSITYSASKYAFVKKGGADITIDSEMNPNSENPISNKAFSNKVGQIDDTINAINTVVQAQVSKMENAESNIETINTNINNINGQINTIEGGLNTVHNLANSNKSDIETIMKGVEVVNVEVVNNKCTIAANVLNIIKMPANPTAAIEIAIVYADEIAGHINHYMIRFKAPEGLSLVIDWEVKWYGDEAPEFTAGKMYELSIVDGKGLFAEFEPTTDDKYNTNA